MRVECVSEYWLNTFQDVKPIPSSFRSLFFDRWMRFHTLPGSKRYAETKDEYSTVIKRYNSVLNEIAKSGKILLFSVCYSSSRVADRRSKSLENINLSFDRIDPNAKYWRTIPMHELDNDIDNPNFWHIYVSEWDWKENVFDEIFKLIADNVVSDIFMASQGQSWIYHPYDGGADVIMSSGLERDKLKEKFIKWLPSNPSGL